MKSLLREPVLITAAVEAVILLAVGFGLDWSGEQVASVMVAVTAVLALITRAVVTPTHDPRGIDGMP